MLEGAGFSVASQAANADALATANAATSSRIKSYHYDHNIKGQGDMNFTHHIYKQINTSYVRKGYQNTKIGGDWNYIRYERVYFYGKK